jgi:2-oxoglutarate ferredoxin oxidoreductase subunit delta
MGEKRLKGKIQIDRELCKGCLRCVEVCPKKVIEISSKLNTKGYYPACYIEEDVTPEGRKCTACTLCAITCPDVAIEVYRD